MQNSFKVSGSGSRGGRRWWRWWRRCPCWNPALFDARAPPAGLSLPRVKWARRKSKAESKEPHPLPAPPPPPPTPPPPGGWGGVGHPLVGGCDLPPDHGSSNLSNIMQIRALIYLRFNIESDGVAAADSVVAAVALFSFFLPFVNVHRWDETNEIETVSSSSYFFLSLSLSFSFHFSPLRMANGFPFPFDLKGITWFFLLLFLLLLFLLFSIFYWSVQSFLSFSLSLFLSQSLWFSFASSPLLPRAGGKGKLRPPSCCLASPRNRSPLHHWFLSSVNESKRRRSRSTQPSCKSSNQLVLIAHCPTAVGGICQSLAPPPSDPIHTESTESEGKIQQQHHQQQQEGNKKKIYKIYKCIYQYKRRKSWLSDCFFASFHPRCPLALSGRSSKSQSIHVPVHLRPC